jgi:preprotein translocase subunit SecE
MTVKKKKKKRRKPKGKPLSEALRQKETARQEEDEELAPEEEPPRPARKQLEDLKSEPPPSFDEDLDEEPGPAHPAPFDEDEEEEEEEEREQAAEPAPSQATAYRTAGEVEEDEEEEEEEEEAALLGHKRYVMAGFFGLWVVGSYVLGRSLELAWSKLASKDWFVEKLPQLAAVPHEGELVSRSSVSMVLGAVLSGLIVLRYLYKPEVRTWADEVAEELAKVKWPTRKEVGNNTVVVIAAAAIMTLYLLLLDRFWSFLTNLIYSTGI